MSLLRADLSAIRRPLRAPARKPTACWQMSAAAVHASAQQLPPCPLFAAFRLCSRAIFAAASAIPLPPCLTVTATRKRRTASDRATHRCSGRRANSEHAPRRAPRYAAATRRHAPIRPHCPSFFIQPRRFAGRLSSAVRHITDAGDHALYCSPSRLSFACQLSHRCRHAAHNRAALFCR